MADNNYHFITEWRMPADIKDIYDILHDVRELSRWWPSVYLDVQQIAEGDASGIGAEFDLYTKGWLPYRLRWQFRVIENQRPSLLALEAWGDFVGRGVWTLVQEGETAVVTFDWNIQAEKELLKRLTFLLRPVFAANHRWAMNQGEKSLKLELARRARTVSN